MIKSKFKFIFQDSATSVVEAGDYKAATILAVGNRIRANKNFSVMGAWVGKTENKQTVWEKIVQQSVSISLS